MSQVRELHNKAMEMADLALLAKGNGELDEFLKYSEQAFSLEEAAASLVRANIEAEPTRSVLHRSAATLALDCKKYVEAKKLIEIALDGKPPAAIAKELRSLQHQITVEFDKANN